MPFRASMNEKMLRWADCSEQCVEARLGLVVLGMPNHGIDCGCAIAHEMSVMRRLTRMSCVKALSGEVKPKLMFHMANRT